MIDRVVSLVIVIGVILALGAVLMVSVFQGVETQQTFHRQSYEYEYGSLLLDSLLLSYENTTNMTYEGMLIQSLQSLSGSIVVEGTEYNVTEIFEETLDELLGPGNYYLGITPVLMGVSVSYVLDGSPTMDVPRLFIEQEVTDPAGVVNDIKQIFQSHGEDEAATFFHIYILGDDSTGYCAEYDALLDPSITCEYLEGMSFYNDIQMIQYDPPYKPPAPGGDTFNYWLVSDHWAGAEYMTESDWGSGALYASLKRVNDPIEAASTNGHVIITVVDELTSSSKADDCFQKVNESDWWICMLCDDTCPEERAQGIIDQVEEIMIQNNDAFIGFHVFPEDAGLCRYAYHNSFTTAAITPYICSMIPPGSRPAACLHPDYHTPADFNFCADTSICTGCLPPTLGTDEYPPPPTDAKCLGTPGYDGNCYCFHQNCNDLILDDLDRLAATNPHGRTIRLENNLDDLVSVVEEYLNDSIASFNFTIGVVDPTRDRYAFEEEIKLINSKSIDITFWVYE